MENTYHREGFMMVKSNNGKIMYKEITPEMVEKVKILYLNENNNSIWSIHKKTGYTRGFVSAVISTVLKVSKINEPFKIINIIKKPPFEEPKNLSFCNTENSLLSAEQLIEQFNTKTHSSLDFSTRLNGVKPYGHV